MPFLQQSQPVSKIYPACKRTTTLYIEGGYCGGTNSNQLMSSPNHTCGTSLLHACLILFIFYVPGVFHSYFHIRSVGVATFSKVILNGTSLSLL